MIAFSVELGISSDIRVDLITVPSELAKEYVVEITVGNVVLGISSELRVLLMSVVVDQAVVEIKIRRTSPTLYIHKSFKLSRYVSNQLK
jgi:hypothetical protein